MSGTTRPAALARGPIAKYGTNLDSTGDDGLIITGGYDAKVKAAAAAAASCVRAIREGTTRFLGPDCGFLNLLLDTRVCS